MFNFLNNPLESAIVSTVNTNILSTKTTNKLFPFVKSDSNFDPCPIENLEKTNQDWNEPIFLTLSFDHKVVQIYSSHQSEDLNSWVEINNFCIDQIPLTNHIADNPIISWDGPSRFTMAEINDYWNNSKETLSKILKEYFDNIRFGIGKSLLFLKYCHQKLIKYFLNLFSPAKEKILEYIDLVFTYKDLLELVILKSNSKSLFEKRRSKSKSFYYGTEYSKNHQRP